jgi:hypothetical protein
MFKKFNDPKFLLEVFYDYNEQVGGKMRVEDQNEDKFMKVSQKFQAEFNETKKLQKEKMEYINSKTNRVSQLPFSSNV